jgi:DNA-binding response OmpR family regulator
MVDSEVHAGLILVVDDQQEVLEQVAAVLGAAGFACRWCRNAEAAEAAAAATPPTLILCDINLPGCGGLELCARLRQSAALSDVPLMFLSGTQTADIIRRSDVVGSTYHLRKPLDGEVLLALVDKILGQPRTEPRFAGRDAADRFGKLLERGLPRPIAGCPEFQRRLDVLGPDRPVEKQHAGCLAGVEQ